MTPHADAGGLWTNDHRRHQVCRTTSAAGVLDGTDTRTQRRKAKVSAGARRGFGRKLGGLKGG